MVECSPSSGRPIELKRRAEELYICPWAIAVDTREQAPWTFQGIDYTGQRWAIWCVRATLATGDYSIAGHEGRLAIERKSAADLTGSIGSGHDRFRREHERMAEIVEVGGFACVIIEGSLSTICEELDANVGRRLTGNTILGATASWPQKYGVPWFFAGDRRYAELLAFRVMLKFLHNGKAKPWR